MDIFDPPYPAYKAFWAVFLSWFVSQLVKVFRGMVKEKRFNFRWLFDTGGMPSSHSATVASLTTCTVLYYGLKTIPSLIAGTMMMITMFDAAGVRRNMGRQAEVLNRMIEDIYEKGQVPEKRLKELLGHTPFEVFAGAFLGFSMALVLCR